MKTINIETLKYLCLTLYHSQNITNLQLFCFPENATKIRRCAVLLTLVISVFMALTTGAPTGDGGKRGNYVHWFNELRKPMNELSRKTKVIEDLYQRSKVCISIISLFY